MNEAISTLFPLRPTIANNPEPAAVVPHIYTFNSVYNSANRMYSYRFDEALRNLPTNALSMRRDAFIEALLQERILPTANRSWSIKVPNQQDAYQASIARQVTEEIRCIPRFERMRTNLMEAVWYGRYGSQIEWAKKKYCGREFWTIGKHRPVNGDKIFNEFDGTPAVAINPTIRTGYPPELTRLSDRGMTLLMLRRPEHRRQFIIHQHQVTDADYFEPELGGGVHGTGLRNKVYWAWWLRDEMLAWCTDFMQKVGTLGLLVFFYEDGNADAKAAAETAAAQASTQVALTMPRPNGPSVKETNGVMHIPANTGGVEALQKMIADYFERHIERLMVGQPSSGGVAGNGFGGSAGAALHADTKYQILKFDAKNLSETLTEDLVKQLVLLNHPDVDFPVEFTCAVANPEDAAKAATVVSLAGIGVTFKADEVRDLTGMSKPEQYDEVVGGMQAAGGAEAPGKDGAEAGGETTPGQGVTTNATVEREAGSGEKWADVAAYSEDGSFFANYAEEEGGGQWVTIGARQGDDGKRHGGCPVLIKNGRIVKGPKNMLGKKPDEVGSKKQSGESKARFGPEGGGNGEPDYPSEWDEPLSEETASKKKPKLRVTDAMRKQLPQGVKMEHVAELAADIRDNYNATVEYKAEALRHARDHSVKNGFGDLRILAAKSARGGKGEIEEGDQLKGFDEVAESTAMAFPGLIDDDRFHQSDMLFEMLLEGQPQKMKDKDAWDMAVKFVQENGLDRKDEVQEKPASDHSRHNSDFDEILDLASELTADHTKPMDRETLGRFNSKKTKLIDQLSQYKGGELWEVAAELGVDGIKRTDSKSSMVRRIDNRLTAAIRARERNEV